MPQLETAIVGKNNTKAGVTGQNELLVRVNSTVNQDTVIISPLGNQPEAKAVAVYMSTDQSAVMVTPEMITSTGDSATSIGSTTRSISFASIGTADALVSFDGGLNYSRIAPGTTINMDAGGLNNIYDRNIFYYDTVTYTGASLLITYNLG